MTRRSSADVGPFYSVDDVIRANARAGQHYFEPGTMRFFRSRVGGSLYGGRFFTTSEQFEAMDGRRDARRYSVRQAFPDGSIGNASEFQAFATARAANREAERLAGLPMRRKYADGGRSLLEHLEADHGGDGGATEPGSWPGYVHWKAHTDGAGAQDHTHRDLDRR